MPTHKVVFKNEDEEKKFNERVPGRKTGHYDDNCILVAGGNKKITEIIMSKEKYEVIVDRRHINDEETGESRFVKDITILMNGKEVYTEKNRCFGAKTLGFIDELESFVIGIYPLNLPDPVRYIESPAMSDQEVRIKTIEMAIAIMQRGFVRKDIFFGLGEAQIAEILYEYIRTGKFHSYEELTELKGKNGR